MEASALQSLIEKLAVNMDRFDGVINGPSSGASSSVELDYGFVPTLAKALASMKGTTIVSTLTEVSAMSIPGDIKAVQTAGKVTVGDGEAGRYVSVMAQPAHDAWVQDASGRFFALDAEHPSRVLYLRDFIRLYADKQVALLKACQALWSSGRGISVLECEGISVPLTAPFRLDSTNIDMSNAGSIDMFGKVVSNLHIRAANGGVFPAGKALFTLAGDDVDNTKLRSVKFVNCKVDCQDRVDFGFQASQYYHLTLDSMIVRGFKKHGIRSARDSSSSGTGDGAHGLVVLNCDVLGKSAGGTQAGMSAQPEIGIYLEDGDAVIDGGWISWTQEGIVSMRGGVHIKDVHLSIADGPAPKVGVRVNAPRGVYVTGCDMDGCIILLTNSSNNMWSPGEPTNFRKIVVTGNEFNMKTDWDMGPVLGLVVFRTQTENTKISGLVLSGNTVPGLPDQRVEQFGTVTNSQGVSGSWSNSFAGAGIVNAEGSAPSNFPGVNYAIRTTAAYVCQMGSGNQRTRIGTDGQQSILGFDDKQNGGSNVPQIGSENRALVFGANGGIQWRVNTGGNLYPELDNAYQIGSGTQRIKQLYAATPTINTSDERHKAGIRPLSDAELACAIELGRAVRAYRWRDAEASKTHVGWIAQEVIRIFAAHGLDAGDYGAVVHDIWDGGDIYGIAYDELQCFVLAGQQQQIDRLAGLLL